MSTTLMSRRALGLALAVLALAAAAACTSRTLPLPPPEVKTVSPPDPSGMVTIDGYSREGASVGVLNDRTMLGTITTSPDVDCNGACAFSAQLQAEAGDPLRAWQFFETPSTIEVMVPPP